MDISASLCKSVQNCAKLCKSVQVCASENSWTYAPSLIGLLSWLDLFYVPITPRHMPSTGSPFLIFIAALRFGTFFRVSSSPLFFSVCLLPAGHSFVHKLFCPPSGAIKSHLNLLKYWPVSGSASTTKMWQDYACNFDEIKESYVRQFWSIT